MHNLILNGVIISRKDFGADEAPTIATKKGVWLPVVPRGDKPEFDPDIEVCESSFVIDETQVTEGWTIRNLTVDELAERKVQIKAEARRRILAVYPDWRQTNMLARGVELQDAWRQNGEWTVSEAAEADALQTAWNWIKSVRTASDELEIDPPYNYADDIHWPAQP